MALPEIYANKMTVDEYFELIAKPDSPRYGWANGYLLDATAMAGGAERHSMVSANLVKELGIALKKKPCRRYEANMMVRSEGTEQYHFPDASIVCEEPVKGKRNGIEYIDNPEVIFEVLSPSTQGDDRGIKFHHYKHIPTLKEYVLISSWEVRIEKFTRQGEDWLLSEVTDRNGHLTLEAPGVLIPINDLYDRVEFSEERPAHLIDNS